VVSTGEYIFASDRLKIPPERVHLIPNGVDTDLFSPVSAEAKRRLRAGMGLPEHEPLLGFIGRSSAQKDPVTLYEAFARAAAIRPMSLLHVGRGELDGELEALVRQRGMGSRVFREPYMSVPVNFYRVVDGFILTSHYEGLSLAAAEALAANLPVILSAAAGNKDFLALPLSHAWQAAPGDIDGFARAIAAWAEKLGTTKPVNHREIAQARFDLREKCGEVLHLYHQLTGETQPVRIQRLPAHSHRRTRTPSRR
jgi:glycosyltransferase involved in cell wall biosynthesis